MRRLHSHRRRRGRSFLPYRGSRRGESRHHHTRRHRHGRQTPSAADGLHCRTGDAVRLLHQRDDHVGQGSARQESAAERRADPWGAGRQSLPLRQPQSNRPGDSAGLQGDGDMSPALLTRREFGGALSGLVIAFSMAPRASAGAESAPRLPGTLEQNRRLDSWLRIDPAGTVTIFTGRVELGQGATTALAQIAAEELDVTMMRVRMIPVDTNHSPNEGVTAGSNSIEAGGAALRSGAAEARAILIQHASQRLGVPADQLIADDGDIFAKSGPQRTSYWEITADMPLAREATNSAPAKPAKDHRLVGRPAQRLDIPDKVMGRPIFIQDMRLPGMVHGRIVRPPSYNAELVRLDDASVRKLPGVIAVARDGRFLGVVAEREEQAIAARATLMKAATWRVPAGLPDPGTVHDYLKKLPDIDTKTVNEKTAGAQPAVKMLTATYRKPYLAHASIGPACGAAGLIDDILTVWSHTQGPYPLRADIAKATGLAPERVRVIHTQGAGCYGHNGADDAALDAALLSLGAN